MECIAVLLVLVLAIAAGSPAACRAEVPCNLVPNGSFEADADRDGIPDGWELSVGPDDRSLVAGLRDGSPTGGRSLCIEKAMAVPGTHLQSSSFALKPHRTYEVRAWLMMEGRFSRDGVQLRVAMDTHRESSELVVNRRWGQSVVRFFTEDETQTGYLQFANLGGLAHRLCIAGVEVCEVEGRVERAPIWVTDLADFEFPEYRPRVAHTAEDLDEIRSSMQGEDIRGHEWVKDAEEWLERPLHLFEEGYAVDGEWREFFMKGLSCARDGARLRPVVHPDGTHEMQCETCDEVYRDEAHRRCARARTNENNARGVGVLGRAYSLTGDTRYAERAAEILVGLARHYKQWGPPPHLAPYPLNEAHALLPIAAGYDDIYSSGALSLEDWRMVERNMLRPAAEFYIDHANTNGRMNNRGAIHNSAVMAIGVAIGDRSYVDQALNSPQSGFHPLSTRIYGPDGLAWEGFGYHTYTLAGLSPIAEMAYRIGINAYADPAYRGVFEAPVQVFLPVEGRPEQRHGLVRHYETVCKRYAEMGDPLEFPFDDEGGVRVIPSSSHHFDHFGYAVLRSGEGPDQTFLSMIYGKEAMFMGHAPAVKFGLVFFANRRLLTPRGAATYGRELCGGWSRRSLAHNSITVDDTDQWGRTEGRCVAFETAPRLQVVRAVDDGAYGGVALDRTLFLTDSYAVDLSGAFADEGRHRFDQCYRIYGELSCGLAFEEREGPLGAGYGYQYLTDPRSARTAKAWGATWRQAEDSAMRLTVLGGPETEVIACTSPSNEDPDENVPAVVARRWAQGTTFAAVWEPHRDQPLLSRIEAMPVDGEGTAEARGAGVEVARKGEDARESYMASYAGGTTRYGDIELDGKAAALRSDAEELEWAHLISGTLLKRGSQSLEASAAASVYVQRLGDGALIVQTGNGGPGTIEVRGGLSDEVIVEVDGEVVPMRAQDGATATFDVVEKAEYRLTGVGRWSLVRLDWKGREHEAAEPRVPAEPEEDSEGTVDEAGAPVADDAMLVGKNKVANAGFEIDPERARGADDPWKCWSSYHFAKFMAPHEYDDQVAHSGGRSLKIEEANWANEATRDGWIEQEVPGVGTGKTLTLSAWVKASKDPTRVRLCIYGWDPEWGRDFEAGVSPKFDIGTEWQRISWTRSFGANITKVHVMVKREHQVLGGDVWIDDVQLEEGTEATDWVPDAWSETMDR